MILNRKTQILVLLICISDHVWSQDSAWFSPSLYTSTPAFGPVWGDFNNDGMTDLWFHTGQDSQRFYINDGFGGFRDSTPEYGLRSSQYFGGVAFGDIDGDGWNDLFLGSRDNTGSVTGSCRLFIHSRRGSFFDMAPRMGLDRGGTAETSVFFDYDGDGDLDILTGFNHTVGNGAFLYRNDGEFFTEVLTASGLDRNVYFEGMQAVDFNYDGYVDVAYQGKLYLNQGDGTFQFNDNGMWLTADEGICFVDLDNDGDWDLVQNSSISGVYKILFFENIGGYLQNVNDSTSLSDSLLSNHWGITTLDIDNDGLKDVIVGGQFDNGTVLGRFLVLRNRGNFKFENYTSGANLSFDWPQYYSDMVASADYDNDGHVDLFIQGQVQGYKLWRNESVDNRFLNLRITGQSGQQNQFGASVILRRSTNPTQITGSDFVGSGPGYSVKSEYDVHFGVDPNQGVDVEVIFPGAVGSFIKVDKSINSALGGIVPLSLGSSASERTIEIRRNGDVIINGNIFYADIPISVSLVYPPTSSYYKPNTDSVVELGWKPFSNAVNYELQYSELSRFDSGTVTVSNVLNEKNIVFVRGLRSLYWRVRANTGNGYSAWSDPSRIIIDTTGLPYNSYYQNDAPSITSAAPAEAYEDSFYQYTLVGYDVDETNPLKFELVNAPTWLRLDTITNVISGTPTGINVGDTLITVGCADNAGGITFETVNLHVIHTNHTPIILNVSDSVANEDYLFESYVYAKDVDSLLFGDQIRYYLITNPIWLAIDSLTGTLSGIPGSLDVGDTNFSVMVSDGRGGESIRIFTLKILHTNHRPQFVSEPDTIAKEDVLFTSKIFARDSDSLLFGDHVRYKVIGGPGWLTLDSITGSIVGTPLNNTEGDTVISVIAYDQWGAISQREWAIRILPTNYPPVYKNDVYATLNDTMILFKIPINRVFSWMPAKDPDLKDTLFYSLVLRTNDFDTVITGIRDTTLMIDERIFSEMAHYEWQVYVTDGEFVVSSPDTFRFQTTKRVANSTYTEAPTTFFLYQNYPNPFNPSTSFRFQIPEESDVKIEVYNILGQRVDQIFNGKLATKYYEMEWRPKAIASGIYFVKFNAEGIVSRKKYQSVRKLSYIK